MEAVIGKIVYIFSDLIFLHLFGWAINPLYNKVADAWAPVIADSMLLLIEFIFYGAVLAGLVILFDKFLEKKRKKKRQQTRYEKIENTESKVSDKKAKTETKGADKKTKTETKNADKKAKTEANNSGETKSKRPYREYV